MDRFITELMDSMTLEEKIGQFNLVSVGFDISGPRLSENVEEKIRAGLVGGVFNNFTPNAVGKLQRMAVEESRMGIPLLFGYDVIHGHRTIFPIPLAISNSWDLSIIEHVARTAADEASADGLNWIYSPMVDIARDPRWGRIAEGAGEDPWYGSLVAKAMVEGYQGKDLSAQNTVMGCVKHFALYGAAEAGRDYNTVDMSRVRMYNEYLPPYRAAVEAGVGSVMTSFNDINGIPATGNHWLLTELLREKWGFNGFVVTDYDAMEEMIAHGVGDAYEVTNLALKAGVEMDIVDELYLKNLPKLVENGDADVEMIERGCRRVLEAKYKLGLFEDPYRYVNPQRAEKVILSESNLQFAREVAMKSMVLLKNNHNLLPLEKSGTIALIGPLARNKRDLIGNWSAAGDWHTAVSLEEGLKNAAEGNLKIMYSKGANITDDEQLIRRLQRHGGNLDIDPWTSAEMIREAVDVAKGSDIIIAAVGESQGMTGEATCRAKLNLPGRQPDLLKALKATGKPLVIVLMNGRPLTISWEQENADAILETWFGGHEAGNAIADILFGDYNPSGKLTTTFPRLVGQVPIYYNHKNTGRPFTSGDIYDKYKSRYLDVSNEPLYPFGYGLSYTRFEYEKPVVSDTVVNGNDSLTISVKVKNTGQYDGEEVVQFYIRDLVGSITRPVKELKGFRKVSLEKGEKTTVNFTLSVDDLKFYNSKLVYDWEPGEFEIITGGNSRDVQSVIITWNK